MKKLVVIGLLFSNAAFADCKKAYDITITCLNTFKWCSTTGTTTGGVCAGWLWNDPVAKGFFTTIASGGAAYVGIAMTLETKLRKMREILNQTNKASKPYITELHSKVTTNITLDELTLLIHDANRYKLFCKGNFFLTTTGGLLRRINDGTLQQELDQMRILHPDPFRAPQPQPQQQVAPPTVNIPNQPDNSTLEIITEEPSFSL